MLTNEKRLYNALYNMVHRNNAQSVAEALEVLQDGPPIVLEPSDTAILGRLRGHMRALYDYGNWRASNFYPSQSEADAALITAIGGHTNDCEQIKRIFLSSALGKRHKAQSQRYFEQLLKDAGLPPIAPLTPSDIAILPRLANHMRELYASGGWRRYTDTYPDVRAADLALVKALAEHTNDANQIERMFLASALGKRYRPGFGLSIDKLLRSAGV